MAKETLVIQNQGFYMAPSGKRVDISASMKHSIQSSYLLTPNEGNNVVEKLSIISNHGQTQYKVINASIIQVIVGEPKTDTPVAVLNFASAKNPGGGFLNGSMAQEEALAISSGLYNTLLPHKEYYEKNRACPSMMYTNHAIYSPDVVFFRDSKYELLELPVTASVLTLPAVNMGQVISKGEDINLAKEEMKNRMRLSLAIFAKEQNERIILGAYGCGVFANNPHDVARWWYELLIDENYACFFKMVLFVILDKPGGDNIEAFSRKFMCK